MQLPPTTEVQHLLAQDRAERLRSSMARPPFSARRRLGSFMVSVGIRLDPASRPPVTTSGSTHDAPADAGASCAVARVA
ncbi:MAG: hypothetical protein ACXWZP_04415 [Gaiellaceae bacterium]